MDLLHGNFVHFLRNGCSPEPTCITESSSSLIDTIFTNWRLVCSGVLHIGISDHSLTYIYIIIVNYLRSLLSNGVRLNKNCKL